MWVSWTTSAAQAEINMSGCCMPIFFVEEMVTNSSLSGNLSSSSCTIGLSSWTMNSEAYFLSGCQNILWIILVISHLPEFSPV